jgi:hypothetical protein
MFLNRKKHKTSAKIYSIFLQFFFVAFIFFLLKRLKSIWFLKGKRYFELYFLLMSLPKVLTTSTGQPVDDNQNSVTAGEYGPVVISDFHLIDKLAHFDRERIPERVVHAKGSGAHGFFKVTHDVSKYTKAKVFESIGKVTPVFTRFSTVAG